MSNRTHPAKVLLPVFMALALTGAHALPSDADIEKEELAKQRPSIPAVIKRVGPSVKTQGERIALLEQQLEQANARLAALEQRLSLHTHDVPFTEVGLLSEPINGRKVTLAISPRTIKVKSSPPTP